ncbi:hypothetical protein AGMMS50225_07100 [Betaproteobacteria bacterium]|nr:hypothetical protein AGMMS50225_07100 [Betaproteobacteria bacterium]
MTQYSQAEERWILLAVIYDFAITVEDGNKLVATVLGITYTGVSKSAVPESATHALLLAGLCIIGVIACRRRNLERRQALSGHI